MPCFMKDAEKIVGKIIFVYPGRDAHIPWGEFGHERMDGFIDASPFPVKAKLVCQISGELQLPFRWKELPDGSIVNHLLGGYLTYKRN